MELKISNDELIEIYQGCRELLTIEDLETLFSFRVSSIVEKMTPMIKAYTSTRETLDKKYLTIEVEKDGEVIGKRTEPHVASEYVDKVQTLIGAGITLRVPLLSMTALYKMREEKGLKIEAATLHNIRKIIDPDMEIEGDNEN